MHDGLIRRVARHAVDHELLPGGAPVLALVSGGADSTCLMHVLVEVHDGPVGVLSFDHGLRDGSAADAESVAATARALGLRAWTVALDLAPGPSLQARARDARYAAARRIADANGFVRIATGHTATDQAETVLFRIARGAGHRGAGGMAPSRGDLIRPLLCLTRAETRAWCAARGLPVVDDPANADPRFARSRVRHGLLVELERVHPGADRSVARFAELMRDEADLLDVLVDEAWRRCAVGDGLAVDALAREHPALARLLARRLLSAAGLDDGSACVARALALAARGGRPVQAPGGLIAVDRGVLVAEAPPAAPPSDALLAVPGVARFGAFVIEARRGGGGDPTPARVALAIDGPFLVRALRPGDRIPTGGGGRRSVARLLADAGVPSRRRGGVPVVVQDERVVWVAGYRADPTLLAAPAAAATVLEVTPA